MAYVDENGEPAGKVIELTNRIAAESGLEITWGELSDTAHL